MSFEDAGRSFEGLPTWFMYKEMSNSAAAAADGLEEGATSAPSSVVREGDGAGGTAVTAGPMPCRWAKRTRSTSVPAAFTCQRGKISGLHSLQLDEPAGPYHHNKGRLTTLAWSLNQSSKATHLEKGSLAVLPGAWPYVKTMDDNDPGLGLGEQQHEA